MPIIKSAIKKMRGDAKKRQRNLAVMSKIRTSLKKARSEKSFASVSVAYSVLDKAVKTGLVKKNFANRQKASLSRLAKPVKAVAPAKPTKKAAIKKTAPKVNPSTKRPADKK